MNDEVLIEFHAGWPSIEGQKLEQAERQISKCPYQIGRWRFVLVFHLTRLVATLSEVIFFNLTTSRIQ